MHHRFCRIWAIRTIPIPWMQADSVPCSGATQNHWRPISIGAADFPPRGPDGSQLRAPSQEPARYVRPHEQEDCAECQGTRNGNRRRNINYLINPSNGVRGAEAVRFPVNLSTAMVARWSTEALGHWSRANEAICHFWPWDRGVPPRDGPSWVHPTAGRRLTLRVAMAGIAPE